MKQYFLSGALLILWLQQLIGDPVVVIMVKNEALVMQATLRPFVDGGIKEFVVLDTGSEDDTVKITTDFFAQYPEITAHIIEEPWVDFATSRNFALDATERLFPEATFMLMIDAEWYTHGIEELIQFCNEHTYEDWVPYYLMRIRGASMEFYTGRLMRCHKNVRFVGVTQECHNVVSCQKVPSNIYFEWSPAENGRKKSAQRWVRDRDLLLKSHEQDPQNLRTLFYLGVTYECLQDLENAYVWYQKRAAMKGWDEEDFITQLYMARIAWEMELKGNKEMAPMVAQHYLTAFSLRPHRAEPLVNLAHYYRNKNQMQLAFLFALRAIKIPYPKDDLLFVEKNIYEFDRYDELGIAAWYVGEYEIGYWAVTQAMQVKPDAPHLHFNLKLFTEKLGNPKAYPVYWLLN